VTLRTNTLDAHIDHELAVAERYRWWGVYLIREKRRLQGIAQAVQAEQATAALGQRLPLAQPGEPDPPQGGETAALAALVSAIDAGAGES